MTRNSAAAVILQAIHFSISRGYQGLRAIIIIILFGFLFEILALWRKSLRPAAWHDCASVVRYLCGISISVYALEIAARPQDDHVVCLEAAAQRR